MNAALGTNRIESALLDVDFFVLGEIRNYSLGTAFEAGAAFLGSEGRGETDRATYLRSSWVGTGRSAPIHYAHAAQVPDLGQNRRGSPLSLLGLCPGPLRPSHKRALEEIRSHPAR
jgi:hypothetical protein